MTQANTLFTIEHHDGRGRCAMASRNMAAGTCVVSEEPWAAVLLGKERCKRCDWSMAQPTHPLLRCSSTGLSFVSRQEQRSAHAEYYKEEYRAASRAAEEENGEPGPGNISQRRRLPPPAQLAVRMLWRGIKQQKAPWRELVSHWERLEEKRQMELLGEAHIVTREVWRGLNPEDLFKDDPSYLETVAVAKLLATVAVNAMTVADEEHRGIGLGLYPSGALLNHGESPNCAQSFRGRRLVIRTIRPVSAGEELTIPYSELAEISCVRRAWLREQYLFDPLVHGTQAATVARDAVLAEVLEYTGTGNSWLRAVPGASWNAHHGVLLGWPDGPVEGTAGLSVLRRVHSKWLRAKEIADAGDASLAADLLLAAWKLASTPECCLGNGHAIRLAISRDAMDLAIETAQWDSALFWARLVAEISFLVYDPQWPVLGLALSKLAKLELYHCNFLRASETAEAALRLLTVAYEEGSGILTELRHIAANSFAEADAELRRTGTNNCERSCELSLDVPRWLENPQDCIVGPSLPPGFMKTIRSDVSCKKGMAPSHLGPKPEARTGKPAQNCASIKDATIALSELD